MAGTDGDAAGLTCDRMHLNPELCPHCRYDPWIHAQEIRRAIKHEIGPGTRFDRILFSAYNREEAEAVKALLTTAELAVVSFSWFEWSDEASKPSAGFPRS